MMTSASVFRTVVKATASSALLALIAFPTAAWAQVGYVHEVSGAVSIQQPAGKSMTAQAGEKFAPGTVFGTGASGTVTLRFTDGQIVVMSPDSVARIGQYRYIAKNAKQSNSAVILTKGEMRFVTGEIGSQHPEGIKITAGMSPIVILQPGGADFVVKVNGDTREEVGLAAVALGEIGVITPYGRIERIEANNYAPWAPGRAPLPPMPLAAAPAMVQAVATGLFAMIVPSNAPVELNAAASTAAIVAVADFSTSPKPSQDALKFPLGDVGALLAALPATAAGTSQSPGGAPAQVAANASVPLAPVPPPVTSGGGGDCRGSHC